MSTFIPVKEKGVSRKRDRSSPGMTYYRSSKFFRGPPTSTVINETTFVTCHIFPGDSQDSFSSIPFIDVNLLTDDIWTLE